MNLENRTLFPATLSRAQLHYRDLLMATLAVKTSYEAVEGGLAIPVPDQLPVYDGDEETEFGVLESDVAPVKAGCDFAIYGPAVSRVPVTQLDLSVQVGPFLRSLRVFGERIWTTGAMGVHASSPVPFTVMPLDYTRAFGGQAAERDKIPRAHPDNGLGRGWVLLPEHAVGTRLPNVEEVDQLITSWETHPLPAGLLPLPRSSALRGLRGISVDLQEQRMAMSPEAFTWSHPRMHLPHYPAGEWVAIRGMTAEPEWRVRLPELNLVARVTLGTNTHVLQLVPDTLVLVPSYRRLWVVWRRAFVYQFLPERLRSVCLDAAAPAEAVGSTTSIAAQLSSEPPHIPIEPPAPPDRLPVPWEMLREMHPLTSIIEALPLCISG